MDKYVNIIYDSLDKCTQKGAFTLDEAYIIKVAHSNIDNYMKDQNTEDVKVIERVKESMRVIIASLNKGTKTGTFDMDTACTLKLKCNEIDEHINAIHKKLSKS